MKALMWRLARKQTIFLLGMGSILDLSGRSLFSDASEQRSIADAIGDDFKAVGCDLYAALGAYQLDAAASGKHTSQMELPGISNPQ